MVCPERVDELAKGSAEGVCETCDCGGGCPPCTAEPHIRIAGWGAENEGLSEADEELADHNSCKIIRTRCAISNPVAYEKEACGYHDRGFWAMSAKRIKGERGRNAVCKENRGGKPVYSRLLGIEILCRCLRDRGKGYPIPRNNDVQQNKLGETEEATFVHFVYHWSMGGDPRKRSMVEKGRRRLVG